MLTYVGAAFLAGPDWGQVALNLVVPSAPPSDTAERVTYLVTLVAVVGTTITPYMLFYLQSSISDKGVRVEDYPAERTDVILGSLLTTVIAVFIIVSTAATLNLAGHPGHDCRRRGAGAGTPGGTQRGAAVRRGPLWRQHARGQRAAAQHRVRGVRRIRLGAGRFALVV